MHGSRGSCAHLGHCLAVQFQISGRMVCRTRSSSMARPRWGSAFLFQQPYGNSMHQYQRTEQQGRASPKSTARSTCNNDQSSGTWGSTWRTPACEQETTQTRLRRVDRTSSAQACAPFLCSCNVHACANTYETARTWLGDACD
eukprot:2071470-Pleurochrysis_carterae.AAC.1